MLNSTRDHCKLREEVKLSEDIFNVTDDTFEEEVLKAELPVLVDFWAVWCGPCQMVAPTVEYLAQNYKDKLRVAKMNVDDNMNVPAKYGIMSIPALLLFKGGEVVETVIGALPQDKIVEMVAKHL
jgi:thioredoxin 1